MRTRSGPSSRTFAADLPLLILSASLRFAPLDSSRREPAPPGPGLRAPGDKSAISRKGMIHEAHRDRLVGRFAGAGSDRVEPDRGPAVLDARLGADRRGPPVRGRGCGPVLQ